MPDSIMGKIQIHIVPLTLVVVVLALITIFMPDIEYRAISM